MILSASLGFVRLAELRGSRSPCFQRPSDNTTLFSAYDMMSTSTEQAKTHLVALVFRNPAAPLFWVSVAYWNPAERPVSMTITRHARIGCRISHVFRTRHKGLLSSRSRSFFFLIRPEDPSLFVTSCLTVSAYVRQPLSQLITVQDARQIFWAS